MVARSPRYVVLLGAALATAVAGCVGRLRPNRTNGAPSAPTVAQPGVPAMSDTFMRRMQREDSVRKADSMVIVRRADSIARANAPITTPAPNADLKKAPATTKAPSRAKRCILDTYESPQETRVIYNQLPDKSQIVFIGGGFIGHCQGETSRLKADSAEHFQSSGIVNLYGNVTYNDPGKMRITANHLTYFTREERMIADGNVIATQLASGSTFSGPTVEYLRPLAGVRVSTRLIAPNRPTARLLEKDSLGRPSPPITIVANTMIDQGDSLMFAWGDVQIDRTDFSGRADSSSYDRIGRRSRLIRTARVANTDTKQPFKLNGDTIDLYNSEARRLERVVALHAARATSQDVNLSAERIDLRLVDQALERAYVFGTGRAKATTLQQELEADSMDIWMPKQRVREVRAIGRSLATGLPDTTKIRSDDRDVLRGDSVIALFDTLLSKTDTTAKPTIRNIHAFGRASSLFQVPSRRGPTFPPEINYATGATIRVAFDSGGVRNVQVDSSVFGVYLAVEVDSLSDSTKGKPSPQQPAAKPSAAPPTKPPARPPGNPPVQLLRIDHRRRL